MRGIGRVLAIALTMSSAAQAAEKGHEALFAAPVEKSRIIVHGLAWHCEDRHCIAASASDSRPVIVCMALARELGPVLDFATRGAPLETDALARCNAPRNGKANVSSR